MCINGSHMFLLAVVVATVLGSGYVPARATSLLLDESLMLPSAPGTPAQSAYERGIKALAAGDLDAAEQAFIKSQAQDPQGVSALMGLAEVARYRGDAATAEIYLQRAIARQPDNAAVEVVWGRFLNSQGRFEEARQAFEAAATANPKAVTAWVSLGVLQTQRFQDHQAAVDSLRKALELAPEHAGAHFSLGVALGRLGQFDEAEKELKTAAELAPENPISYDELGKLYLARGDYGASLKAFDRAIEIDPKMASAHVARGTVLGQTGEYDAAADAFEKALSIDPEFPGVQTRIGMVRHQQERWPEAEKAYRRAIALDGADVLALNNLAALMVERGENLDEALALAQKADEILPDVPSILDTLGWIYRARGNLDRAAMTLERAAEKGPNQAIVHYHLGVVYEEQGRKDKAATAFRNALEISDDFAQAEDARKRLEIVSR